MEEDKVVNIRTRRPEQRDPNVWAMVEQLVGTVGVTEVIRIMADMSSDLPHLRLFLNVPNNAEINERVAEILRDAARHLDFLESDSWRVKVTMSQCFIVGKRTRTCRPASSPFSETDNGFPTSEMSLSSLRRRSSSTSILTMSRQPLP